MIHLTTLTQEKGPRAAWLAECIKSIPARPGLRHHVVFCDDFLAGRWAGMQRGRQDDLVGFVDDDDHLTPGEHPGEDPVSLCERALAATGAGIAFTWDRILNEAGEITQDNTQAVTYESVAASPYWIRQFSLIRRECITDAALNLAKEFGHGLLDWAIKAQVAFDHGAVQVPMIGYERRRHANNMGRSSSLDQFRMAQVPVRAWRAASGRAGLIPQWSL